MTECMILLAREIEMIIDWNGNDENDSNNDDVPDIPFFKMRTFMWNCYY